MSTDLSGQMLGPYQIIEFVGMEGSAEVYKGYHSEQNIPALVRLVGRGLPADPVWSARFRREAKIIAALKHANIAPILDFGEALDGHYMVSELIEGATLADVLVEVRAGLRSLAPDDITFIVRQIAAGLDEAHGKGAVHRDVNPRRILITRSGQAILTDFGLAMLLSRGADEAAGGAALGAPEYMAPEVIADFRQSAPASDIYSVGAILFEIVCGEPPVGGLANGDAVWTLPQDGPDPRLLSKNVPPTVAHTIMTALAATPKDRFKNALQLAEQLEWAYHNPLADPDKRRKQPKRDELTMQTQPTQELAVAGRSPADQVVVKRGPSLMDERREKARLRAEHRKLQNEEKKRIAAEKRRQDGIVARAFFGRWGRTFVALILFTAVIIGILYGLTSYGILHINVIVPTIEVAANLPLFTTTEAPILKTTEAVVVTDSPVVTQAATQPPSDAGSPTPSLPIVVTPLDMGSSALRLADGGAMQYVPAGEFMMGTDNSRFLSSVRPQHPVTLSAYWIDTTEVTNIQYAACVSAGACAPPTKTVYYTNPAYADFPVTFVAYEQAASYCLWLAGETGQVIGLPTEAQWEKAAAWDPVSGTQRMYPWGDNPPNGDLVRYVFSPEIRPASPVGAHPQGASAYGAQDMSGNVWEWTSDWFDPEYYQQADVANDPAGPISGADRVTRGGSWREQPDLLIVIKRNPTRPDINGDGLGFRCAMSTERPTADSGIVVTPLDATQGLASIMNSATGVEPGLLAEWFAALNDMRDALQTGDDGAALALIDAQLDRLAEQQSTGLLSDSLAWQLKRGLIWTRGRLAPKVEATATAAALLPTETIAPTEAPAVTGTAAP